MVNTAIQPEEKNRNQVSREYPSILNFPIKGWFGKTLQKYLECEDERCADDYFWDSEKTYYVLERKSKGNMQTAIRQIENTLKKLNEAKNTIDLVYISYESFDAVSKQHFTASKDMRVSREKVSNNAEILYHRKPKRQPVMVGVNTKHKVYLHKHG